MTSFRSTLAAAAALSVCVSGIAMAQSANPTCQRLEAQLTSLDRGNADPARADQIRRAEDAVNRQQFELDQRVAQARRMGCENTGFFSIFNNPPAQCGGLNRQIDQMRMAMERTRGDLERLSGGTTERAAQRQSLIIALSNNNCGPQYRQAAVQGQQGGFFDRLFGGGGGSSGGYISQDPGPMGGTYRTLCVRTCDGYYYPISFATTPDRFQADENICQRTCPAAEVYLYTYHNPGEDVTKAVSIGGRPYTELPAAFRYRTALDPSCSCRRPGETWADALKNADGDMTLAPGDVVVTEQNARRLSQPRTGADGKPIRPDLRGQTGAVAAGEQQAAPAAEIDPSRRTVRPVGPTFLPTR